MKLIIMGSGYVGMSLLASLQQGLHELYITTTQKARVKELEEYGKEVLVLCDENEKIFKQWIDSADAIVIMVAPGAGSSYEDTYLNTAKKITENLRGRTKPFYMIYTSSTSVYEGSENTNNWVREDAILNPESINGKILLEAEKLYHNAPVMTCILRLGGIYGPGRELEDRARRLSGKEMPGDGSEPTNNIHLEDIVRAIHFCLERTLTGTYNLVNDDHPTRKELYQELCTRMNLPSPIWMLTTQRKGYKVSNEKIKHGGLIFKHPFLPTYGKNDII